MFATSIAIKSHDLGQADIILKHLFIGETKHPSPFKKTKNVYNIS